MSHACAQDTSLWRALLSSKVGLVVVVTFFGVSLSHTSAESQDVTPPDSDGVQLYPDHHRHEVRASCCHRERVSH